MNKCAGPTVGPARRLREVLTIMADEKPLVGIIRADGKCFHNVSYFFLWMLRMVFFLCFAVTIFPAAALPAGAFFPCLDDR